MSDENHKLASQRVMSSRYTIAFFAIVVCPIIGLRNFNVGSDTQNYAEYFSRFVSGEYSGRFEIGFRLLSSAIALLTDNPNLYFYIIALIVALSITVSMQLFYEKCGYWRAWPFFAYGVPYIVSSSWFVTATINGLRQGLSLALLYIGCLLLFTCKKPRHALAVILTSLFFHYTSIFAALTIFAAHFVSMRTAVVVYVLVAAGYPLGLNEQLVMLSSQLLNIDLHGSIAGYAGGSARWHGWQWDLFLYTIFWPILYFACIPLVRPHLRAIFISMIKIYMALCVPYFFFGFGSFSNRWAFTAWLFLPILHFSFLVASRFSVFTKMLFSAGLFSIGSLKFLNLMQIIDLPYLGGS